MITYKTGDKVKCSLTGSQQYRKWYTGTIVYLEKVQDGLIVDIKRDDGEFGSGSGGSWATLITTSNYELIKCILGDWDK